MVGYFVQSNEFLNSAKFQNFIGYLHVFCEERLKHWTLCFCSFSKIILLLTTKNSDAAYEMKGKSTSGLSE